MSKVITQIPMSAFGLFGGVGERNAALEVVHDAAQVLDQLCLFCPAHGEQSFVMGVRTAWRAR